MSDVIMPNSGAKTFSDHEESELIEQGEYEVTLELAEPKLYGANQDRPGVMCKFRIRRDVEQPEKGRTILDTMWLDKDQENWAGWYDHKKIHKILLSQTNPKLDFQTCDECIQYINGLNMRITILKKFDEYRNKDVNEISYLSYAKSNATSTTVSDPMVKTDDLPF